MDVKLFRYIYCPKRLCHFYDSGCYISKSICCGFALVPWVTGSTLKQRWAPVGFFECKIEYTVTHIQYYYSHKKVEVLFVHFTNQIGKLVCYINSNRGSILLVKAQNKITKKFFGILLDVALLTPLKFRYSCIKLCYILLSSIYNMYLFRIIFFYSCRISIKPHAAAKFTNHMYNTIYSVI